LRKVFFLLFILSISHSIVAQKEKAVLWSEWKNTNSEDSVRFASMESLLWDYYLFTNADSAILMAKVFVSFTDRTNSLSYKVDARNALGTAYYVKGSYTKSLNAYKHAVVLIENSNEDLETGGILCNMGTIYDVIGDIPNAIKHYEMALEDQEKRKDTVNMANSLFGLGNIQRDLQNEDLAIEYYTRAFKLASSQKDKRVMGSVMGSIAKAYEKRAELDSAIYYSKKALTYSDEANDESNVAMIMTNIGRCLLKTGKNNEALKYLRDGLSTAKRIGDSRNTAVAHQMLGDYFFTLQQIDSSRFHYEQSRDISRKTGIVLELVESTKALASIYYNNKEYKLSAEMYEEFIASRDSLLNVENQNQAIRTKYKYEYEKDLAEERSSAQLREARASLIFYILLIVFVLSVVFGLIIFGRFRITKKQKTIIEDQKKVVDSAFKELDDKNREILDSISYAKRIQAAILPRKELIERYLPESFVLYKPKDIVAGDFYWLHYSSKSIKIAAADCTGHGVPGAMVSVVCNNRLNQAVKDFGLEEPGDILNKTRDLVVEEFQVGSDDVQDGMDIALVTISGTTLKFAGANNPLWIIRSGSAEVEEIKGHKQPIGQYSNPTPFPTHQVEVNKGDSFYIFSDGFVDQFGGEKGKKFRSGKLKALLLSIQAETMTRQKELLDEAFEAWRGTQEQLDDVCLLGVRL